MKKLLFLIMPVFLFQSCKELIAWENFSRSFIIPEENTYFIPEKDIYKINERIELRIDMSSTVIGDDGRPYRIEEFYGYIPSEITTSAFKIDTYESFRLYIDGKEISERYTPLSFKYDKDAELFRLSTKIEFVFLSKGNYSFENFLRIKELDFKKQSKHISLMTGHLIHKKFTIEE